MSKAATNVVELLVGLACLGAAFGLRRRPGLVVLAGLLGVAGAAAIFHAVWVGIAGS
jgi:hypothetical protein